MEKRSKKWRVRFIKEYNPKSRNTASSIPWCRDSVCCLRGYYKCNIKKSDNIAWIRCLPLKQTTGKKERDKYPIRKSKYSIQNYFFCGITYKAIYFHLKPNHGGVGAAKCKVRDKVSLYKTPSVYLQYLSL